MGDGIEPIIRATWATAASGLIGIAHGVMNSTIYDMPEIGHVLASYSPTILSSIHVASSKYGIKTSNDRLKIGAMAGGFSATATLAGYCVTRVVLNGLSHILK